MRQPHCQLRRSPCLARVAPLGTQWTEDDCLPIILNFRQDKEGEPVTAQRPQRAQRVEDCPKGS